MYMIPVYWRVEKGEGPLWLNRESGTGLAYKSLCLTHTKAKIKSLVQS